MNEWQCSYCKRVNDFSHKTCDGCGANKEIQDKYYNKSPYGLKPVYITTAGSSRGDWFLMTDEQVRRYDRMIMDEPDYGELARYGI